MSDKVLNTSKPQIITFGCRLNTYESEVMRDHAEQQSLDNGHYSMPSMGRESAFLLNSESYDTFQMFFQTIPGRLLMLGWVFSFFYHLANGIRHLFWDAGYGFELRTTYISGWVVVGVAFALTLAFALGS